MASRNILRTLHSSAIRAAGKGGNGGSGRPASATDLGFSGEKRTRVLPSLAVPSSGRGNIESRTRPGPPRDRTPKQAPKQEAKPVPAASDDFDIPEEFFSTKPKEAAKQMSIPAEFFEGSEHISTSAPSSSRPRNPRNDRGPRQNDRKPTGERKSGGKPQDRKLQDRKPQDRNRKPRDGRDGPKVVEGSLARRPFIAPPKAPTSPMTLFGGTSILNTRLPPAANPAESFWAKDMERAAAFKADTLRRLGSYDLFVAPAPGGKSPKDRAVSTAAWLMANNRTISMRKAAQAVEDIKKLL